MQQNVLICPLDWGIGHATRMIPLASMLQKRDYNIFIAAPAPVLSIFNNPDLTKIALPGTPVWYPWRFPLIFALILQSPRILFISIVDRFRIESLVKKYNIDLLISDNRFGCRSKKVRSVYITHQINIASTANPSRSSRLLSAIHRWYINRYDECWIPDNPAPDSIAGMLSDPSLLRIKYKYIGLLSHLETASPIAPPGLGSEPFYLLILSGPEPMKSHFARQVISLFKESKYPLVVAGSAETGTRVGREIIMGHAGSENLSYLIENCRGLICRSGYSTVMDLVALRKSALLIPTPGQSEQEYLAKYLSDKKLFRTVSQKNLNLEHIVKAPLSF